jgi:hypothetical protein
MTDGSRPSRKRSFQGRPRSNNHCIALVTGANKGIGLEIAHQLAHAGVAAIIVEPASIRGVGRNDNFEKTCEATPLGAARFAVLIGYGGPGRTRTGTGAVMSSEL